MNPPSQGAEAADDPKRPARWLPGRRLPVAAAVLVLGGMLLGEGWVAVVVFGALLVALARYDAQRAWERTPMLERHLPKRWVVGLEDEVSLELWDRAGRGLEGAVRDVPPPGWEADTSPRAFQLAAGERVEIRYRLRPTERGEFRFGDTWLRLEGPWGLGSVIVSQPGEAVVRALPSVVAAPDATRAVRIAELREAGLRRLRRVGGGGEFEQLREYVPGDPYRAIDWKGTARRRWPVVRQYAHEWSRTVLLVLDNGRSSMRVHSGRPALESAIDAMLLLAFVGLRHDDRVGLCVASSEVEHYLPPARGARSYRRLLDVAVTLRSRSAFVDPVEVAKWLRARLTGRAIVIWLGDVLDPAVGEGLERAAALIGRRHDLLAVAFEDEALREALCAPVRTREDAARRAAALDVAQERARWQERLRRRGIHLVEAAAHRMGALAVEHYLEARRRPG